MIHVQPLLLPDELLDPPASIAEEEDFLAFIQ